VDRTALHVILLFCLALGALFCVMKLKLALLGFSPALWCVFVCTVAVEQSLISLQSLMWFVWTAHVLVLSDTYPLPDVPEWAVLIQHKPTGSGSPWLLEEIMAPYWKSSLTNIFGAKRQDITGGWRKLNNVVLLHCLWLRWCGRWECSTCEKHEKCVQS
jgi:hypothetical protein